MSCILHIETSTSACSVAVSEDGQNVFKKEDLNGPSHAVSLGVFVDEALSFADSHAMPLDAVAVSCGPGSYTGLRIGVSMAKGVCYGRNLPLIGLETLKVQCVPVLLYHDELPDDALLCPMIDARRMEVYAAIYDRALKSVRDIAADIVDENSYLEFLEQHPVYFFGAVQPNAKRKSRIPMQLHRRHPPACRHDVPVGRKGNSRTRFQGCGLFRTLLFEGIRSRHAKETYLGFSD